MASRAPARKTPARGASREPAKPASGPKKPDLLSAGLSALRDAHGRHSRLFETLIGVDPASERRTLFKLPTFENLFDERVARSLEQLGVVQALAELRERIDALDARLKRLEPPPQPRAPAKRSKRANKS